VATPQFAALDVKNAQASLHAVPKREVAGTNPLRSRPLDAQFVRDTPPRQRCLQVDIEHHCIPHGITSVA
jgi:hypothetical protein